MGEDYRFEAFFDTPLPSYTQDWRALAKVINGMKESLKEHKDSISDLWTEIKMQDERIKAQSIKIDEQDARIKLLQGSSVEDTMKQNSGEGWQPWMDTSSL